MPAYKVYYFNSRGRAEVIRLLLAQAGVEFEDIRYTREEWAEKGKAAAPMGMAPYMEVDGKKLGQSMACARYIAKEYGMMGNSPWAEAEINQVADTVEDVVNQLIKIHYGKTDDDKAEGKEKVSVHVTSLQKLLLQSSDGNGYYVGDTVSLADIVAFSVLEMVFKMVPESKDAFPKLADHSERISLLPNIASWLNKRPVTDM